MRELKFRVWDNTFKEYVRPDYNIIGYVYPLDGTLGVNDLDDCTIEQYTGLRDKNDKEIYEGDIVENTYKDVGKVRYEVRWECGRFVMESRKPVNLVQIGMGVYPHSSEVIGNIHENPELLEEKDGCR